jgi:hypothetical protein
MSTFGKEEDTYLFESHEAIDEGLEIGAILEMAREGAQDKVGLGDDDSEHGDVRRKKRITEHLPESRAAGLNVTEGGA